MNRRFSKQFRYLLVNFGCDQLNYCPGVDFYFRHSQMTERSLHFGRLRIFNQEPTSMPNDDSSRLFAPSAVIVA